MDRRADHVARGLAERHEATVSLAGVHEALEQFSQLIVDAAEVLDPDLPLMLDTRENLAVALERTGRVAEAISETRSVLADLERVQGPSARTTVLARKRLARLTKANP